MKKLAIIKRAMPPGIPYVRGEEIELEATLQALCDAVNELSEPRKLYCDVKDCKSKGRPHGHGGNETLKRFEADGVIVLRHGFSPEEWSLVGFKTKAEAQAALELLLNL